jgi:hypothetical protein
MGEEISARDGRIQFELNVVGTRPVVSATLIRGGEKIKSFPGNGTPQLHAQFAEAGLTGGPHWYYWEIAQEGTSTHYRGNTCVARGHLAWSGPHWVHGAEE